jgi:S-ribosylhomocysteine lyase
MAEVESFNLDHTRVHAPYVRRAGRHVTAHGDVISKWDLRFAQPNRDALPTGAVHTLEHLLAGGLRDELPNVLDLSPMGCRTGFYLVHDGELEESLVAKALKNTLERVVTTTHIPGVSELECGNYRDHDLAGARDWARRVLEAGVGVQETVRIPDGASSQ